MRGTTQCPPPLPPPRTGTCKAHTGSVHTGCNHSGRAACEADKDDGLDPKGPCRWTRQRSGEPASNPVLALSEWKTPFVTGRLRSAALGWAVVSIIDTGGTHDLTGGDANAAETTLLAAERTGITQVGTGQQAGTRKCPMGSIRGQCRGLRGDHA